MKALRKIDYMRVLLALKHFFTKNIGLKLLSLLITLVFWAYIIDTTPTLTREKYIEGLSVSVSGSSALNAQGLALATDVYKDYVGKIDAMVKVSQNQFSKVNSANIGVVLDVTNVRSAGTHQLSLSAVSVYGEVTRLYPDTITVQIDNLDSRDVPIEVVITGATKDDLWYSADTESLNPQSITISGPASIVQNAAGVNAAIDVTNHTSPFRRTALLTIVDQSGQALNNRLLSRSSSTCSVSVNVYPTKELSVYVDAHELNVKDGYVIDSISFQPATITVAAEQTLLDDLESLPLEIPDNMPEAEKTFTKRFPLSRLSELKYVSTRQVYMNVSISEENDTCAIDDIVLHVNHLTDGFTASIYPPDFNVQVTGPRSQIENLTSENVYAYVDTSNLSEGTYELPVIIGNNPHFSYASLTPSVVKVVITKDIDGEN